MQAPTSNPTDLLPKEIWDYAIDFLSYDPLALVSLSRTCRTFLPRSRYHLFELYNLDLRREDDLDAFLHSIRRNADVAFYVRILQLGQYSLRGKSAWHFRVPLTLAPSLKNLLTLKIYNLTGYHPTFLQHLSFFRTVGSLSLYSALFRNFADMARLLLSLRRLEVLQLVYAQWQSDKNSHLIGTGRSRNFRLRCLVVAMYSYWNRDLVDLVDWLLTTPTVGSLESLSAACPGVENCMALGRLIGNCTRKLQELEISIPDDNDNEWTPDTAPSLLDNITISNNTSLTRLRVQDIHVSSIPSLLTFLSKAPPHINTLYLNIRGLPADLSSAPWDALDTLISTGDNFKELEEVGVVIGHTVVEDWVRHLDVERDQVIQWFPKVNEKGLLRDFRIYRMWRDDYATLIDEY